MAVSSSDPFFGAARPPGRSVHSHEEQSNPHPQYATDADAAALDARLDLIEGVLTTYTPTWTSSGTQPVLNNGTLTGRYFLSQKRLDVIVNLTIGSTTTNGTGLYNFALPFTATTGIQYNGAAWIVDSGTGYYNGTCHVNSGGTTLNAYFEFPPNNASTFSASDLSATFPVTPATNDQFQFEIVVFLP